MGVPESEDAPEKPEASEGAGFQLFDLVHEEGDSEANAGVSCKVSTCPEKSTGLPWKIVPGV